MKEDKNKYERPEAYPKPTQTDNQLRNQPEFMDQEPNQYDKEISAVPVKSNTGQSADKEENID